MQQLSIEEIRKIQIGMLEYFNKYCEEHSLKYSLCGGSLLGAIRHGGYIPWDDDIDVMMPREDYMKLKDLGRINERYIFKSPYEPDTNYPYSSIKMCDLTTELIEENTTKRIKSNVYIDIFPIDGLPNSRKKCERYFKRMKRRDLLFYSLRIAKYNRMYGSCLHKLLWTYIDYISHIIDATKIIEKTAIIAQRYKFDTSEYIGNVTCSGYGIKERMKKEIFDIGTTEFEGKRFKAIKGYDVYLKNLYGNYMELPPKEKRTRVHNYTVYYK